MGSEMCIRDRPRAYESGVTASTSQERQCVEQQGFTRPSLTRDHMKTARQIHIGGFDQGKVSEGELIEHVRGEVKVFDPTLSHLTRRWDIGYVPTLFGVYAMGAALYLLHWF